MWHHVLVTAGAALFGAVGLVTAAVVSCWRAERRLFKSQGHVTHEDWEALWEIKPPEAVLAFLHIANCGVHWDGQTQSFVVTYPKDRHRMTPGRSDAGISLLVHYNAPLDSWKKAVDIARTYSI